MTLLSSGDSAMKELPIGIQTFQKIREDDYCMWIKQILPFDLIANYEYVFLSHPRRFGKSLFVDTLHNLFEGKKRAVYRFVSGKKL